MRILLLAAAAALLLRAAPAAAAPAPSILPGGCVRTPPSAPAPPPLVYRSWGREAEAALTEVYVPPGHFPSGDDDRFLASPVLLGEHLPYPNPFSHAFAVVTVGREADFTVEVTLATGTRYDAFAFADVVPGIYAFTLADGPRLRDDVVVGLLHGGTLVNRLRLSRAALAAAP